MIEFKSDSTIIAIVILLALTGGFYVSLEIICSSVVELYKYLKEVMRSDD